MTKGEIAAEMTQANINGDRPQLGRRLRKMNPTDVFEAIFSIAADAQWHGPAYRAACLLFVLTPPCPISCRDAIRELLAGWDISIEEVPWYLAGQFSQEIIRQAIEDLRKESLDHEQTVALETVKYWTDIYFTLTPTQIQEAEHNAQRIDE